MAIAAGGVADVKFSMAIALAIAIHNIPEGICTAAPHFHATGRRIRSFLISSSTALPIIAGFVIARYIFQNIAPEVIGFIIGGTAGLMIYITADELIPTSCTGRNHATVFSLIAGVVFVIFLESI
jgi:ZIP family zinc transporter